MKKKIFIAGHNGMVGSAIFRILSKTKNKIIVADKKKLNLLDLKKVNEFIKKNKPDQIYIAAARVGGIKANNDLPAKFIYENTTINNNIIHSAYLNKIKKILFLGSSCIYPRNSKLPIKEKYLLSNYLELTNEAYAIAKISGIKMCQFYNKEYSSLDLDYRSIMPCNLYGPGDNFDKNLGHVIPSLLFKFHEAKKNNKKKILLWGDGKPKREFLHVDDLARGSILLMNISKKKFYKDKNFEHINIGSGKEISIKSLATIIKKIVGFKGKISFDKKNPNGTMRKVLDISKVNKLGFKPKIKIKYGIQKTYDYFLKINNE